MTDPTPIVLRLPFDRPPILVNEGRNGHWRARASSKQTVQAAVVAVIRHARVPQMDRMAVTITWHAPDYNVRDPDGLGEMLKACLDSCTPSRPAIAKGTPTQAGTPRKKAQAAKLGAGIIPDDNAVHVASVTMAIVLGSDDPRVELRLDPLPALPPRTKTARSPKTPGRHLPR